MTHTLAVLHILVGTTSTKKGSSSSLLLPLLLVVGVGGYFFFIRPQQKKAQAARSGGGSSPIEVGDDVQTIGGVIGTVLEIHGDRYTLLTGALGPDGNLDGPQPTRIVFIRQAIARKIERVEDVEVDDDADDADDEHEGTTEIEDDGPEEAAHDGSAGHDADADGEAGEEAKEA
jgi:preprotein translocase subunit YajC